jgi:hypothetical protein
MELALLGRLFGEACKALGEETNVRFGSEADIEERLSDVRFTPKSGHRLSQSGCPLYAETPTNLTELLTAVPDFLDQTGERRARFVAMRNRISTDFVPRSCKTYSIGPP